MFSLSCARVRPHTGHEMSAHKKTWSTQKFSFKHCFCTYFIHVILNIEKCWYNVAHRTFYVHTDLKKLEGTLGIIRYDSCDNSNVR